MRSTVAALLFVLAAPGCAKRPLPPPATPAPVDLSVRWVRASQEWVAVVRQTYTNALDELLDDAAGLSPGTPWVVVSDLDETLLDNSAYQVEIARTGGHTDEAWRAWEERREAVPMPGAVELVAAIHAAGGQLAYVTNRRDFLATMDVLARHGLWDPDDRLCVRTGPSDKTARRAEVRTGTGGCGWEGEPRSVVAYLGDQEGDFPAPSEEPDAPEAPWGDAWWMLPNPMYGAWTAREAR